MTNNPDLSISTTDSMGYIFIAVAGTWRPWWVLLQHSYHVATIIFHRWAWYHALSVRYA